MSTLTNKTVAESYRDLLHTSNNNLGVGDETPTFMYDGDGKWTPLGLTTETVHLSGNITLAENGEFNLGTPQKRLSTVHTNTIQLNGKDLTLNPTTSELSVDGSIVNTRNTVETTTGGGDIGLEYLSEIGEGSWTLPDGDDVGQVKVISTLGETGVSGDTIIDITTFATGTQITFDPVESIRQAVTLVWGTNGWVVTGKSHEYQNDSKGPIIT